MEEWRSVASMNLANTVQNVVMTLGLLAGSLLCVYFVSMKSINVRLSPFHVNTQATLAREYAFYKYKNNTELEFFQISGNLLGIGNLYDKI